MSLCGNNNPCPDLITGQKCGITYTGARYVPLFADPAEWSSANAYEPLTIVIHEGNSYTSKTFVPVGVDISNEQYWALTGNYNAQVEAYRQEVRDYVEKIDLNTANIATNKENIQRTTNWRNKTVLFIGDSWGTNNYGVTSCYIEEVSKTLGFNLINISQGSTGFTTPLAFNTMLNNWVTSNPELAKTVNYVMFSGGINDYNTPIAQITTAIKKFIDNIHSKLPDATVYMIPQIGTNTMGDNSFPDSTENVWKKAYLASLQVESNYNENTVNINNGLYLMYAAPSTFFNSDKIHPTQIGHNFIAKWLTAKLAGGIGVTQSYMSTAYTTNVSTYSSTTLVETFENVTINGSSYIENDKLILRYYFVITPTQNYNTIKIPINNIVPINPIAKFSEMISYSSGSGIELAIINIESTDKSPNESKLNLSIKSGGTPATKTIYLYTSIDLGYTAII